MLFDFCGICVFNLNKMLQMVSIRDYTHGPARAAADMPSVNSSFLATLQSSAEAVRAFLNLTGLTILGQLKG